MKIIDMRLRPPFSKFLEGFLFSIPEFAEQYATRLQMSHPESAKKKSMELCIKEMDEAGITYGVVPGRKCFGMDNQDLITLMEDYPNRFITLAGIDPLEGAGACVQEIDRFVINGPCTGITIEPGFCAEPLCPDDKRIYPIYEKCQAANIPVLIAYGGLCHPAIRYFKPETIDNVAGDFPGMRMILGHGGFPWVTEMCWIAIQRPNVYLSPDLYIMHGPGHQDYIALANTLAPDKVVFGSAYPITAMKDAAEWHLNCGIRADILPDVMYNNAARALGLK